MNETRQSSKAEQAKYWPESGDTGCPGFAPTPLFSGPVLDPWPSFWPERARYTFPEIRWQNNHHKDAILNIHLCHCSC